MCVCEGTQWPKCSCGGQRATFRSRFSPPTPGSGNQSLVTANTWTLKTIHRVMRGTVTLGYCETSTLLKMTNQEEYWPAVWATCWAILRVLSLLFLCWGQTEVFFSSCFLSFLLKEVQRLRLGVECGEEENPESCWRQLIQCIHLFPLSSGKMQRARSRRDRNGREETSLVPTLLFPNGGKLYLELYCGHLLRWPSQTTAG